MSLRTLWIVSLSNYATMSKLKGAACIGTSQFAEEADLARLKSDICRLDVDKLETTAVELIKLRMMRLLN